MAARSVWKGNLSLGALVNVPIGMYIAIDDPNKGLKSNLIHADCKTQIAMPRSCKKCNRELPPNEVVKGYPDGKGGFVLVSDSEMESCKPASDKNISIDYYTSVDDIPSEYYDSAYYIVPTEKGVMDAFAVVRDALAKSQTAAIGTLTFHDHEHLIAIAATDDKALILYILREHTQFRDVKDVPNYGLIPDKAPSAELAMMLQIIDAQRADFDPTAHEDSMRKNLRAMLDKKLAGQEIVVSTGMPAAKPSANVMDALKSVLAAQKAKKAPAKSAKKAPRITSKARSQKVNANA